jgi:hypothetical protein
MLSCAQLSIPSVLNTSGTEVVVKDQGATTRTDSQEVCERVNQRATGLLSVDAVRARQNKAASVRRAERAVAAGNPKVRERIWSPLSAI